MEKRGGERKELLVRQGQEVDVTREEAEEQRIRARLFGHGIAAPIGNPICSKSSFSAMAMHTGDT